MVRLPHFWSTHRWVIAAGVLLAAVVGGYLFLVRSGATSASAPTHPADDIPMPGYGFPTRFKVEAAETADFTSPISLVDFTDADHRERTDVAFVLPVAGVSARYVRVTATRLLKGRGMDHFFALSEVQIFSGGTNVARGQPVEALDRHEGARWHPRFLVDGFNSRRRLEAVSERDAGWSAVQAALRVQDRQRQQELALYRASLPPEDGKRLDAVVAGLGAVRDSLDALPEPARVYAAATDFPAMAAFTPPAGIRPIHLLNRGDTEQPGEPVPPGTISALDGLSARFDGRRGREPCQGKLRRNRHDKAADRRRPQEGV